MARPDGWIGHSKHEEARMKGTEIPLQEQKKETLKRVYAARLAERTAKPEGTPMFRLTEVKRDKEAFMIQCCIR
ncbi:MAG: hypothetical protein ACRDRD_10315 [Pseudonocardiaceae bacterium]